jgi:hypothetical protein
MKINNMTNHNIFKINFYQIKQLNNKPHII